MLRSPKEVKKNKFLESSSYSLLVRDMFLTIFISGFASFLNYVFNIITVNSLPPASYSVFLVALGIIYLFQIPATTLQSFFAKQVAEDERFLDRNVYIAVVKQFAYYALLGAFLLLVLTPLISRFTNIGYIPIMLISITLFGSIFTPIVKGFLLGTGHISVYNIATVVEVTLKLAILIFSVRISNGATGPIIAFGLPTLIVGFILSYILFRSLKGSVKKIEMPKLDWRFLGIAFSTLFLFNGYFSIDVLLVDEGIRASYGVLTLFSKIVFFSSSIATLVLYSYFVNSRNTLQKKRFLFIGILVNSGISLAIVYAFAMFGEILTEVMFTGKYTEIIPYITPISISIAFYSLAYIFVLYMISERWSVQIPLLFIILLFQILLFSIANSTLTDVVINQIVVYSSLSISVVLLWYFTDRRVSKVNLSKN